MSFALTTEQIRNRTKTVTRRIGWDFVKPGDLIQAIEKGQGLKKGEKFKKLAVLRIESVSFELLMRLTFDPLYGHEEMTREGFQSMDPKDFIEMFCRSHRVFAGGQGGTERLLYRDCRPEDEVTRIEFSYVDEHR
jgi:hypothetical protein